MLNSQRWREMKARRRTHARGVGLELEPLEARSLLTTAAFAVTSDWGSGLGAQITITNTQSTPIDHWSLAFHWDRAITHIWNGTIVSHVGSAYVVSGASWDRSIPASGSISFGLTATPGNLRTDVPSGYILNGVPAWRHAAAAHHRQPDRER